MSEQNILELLKQSANQKKTFADRLREEREAFQGTAKQFVEQTTPQDMYTSNGVPLQPSKVMTGRQALVGAVEQAASGFSPETEMAARDQYTDLLLKIAGMGGEKQPSISDQLAAADAGYQIVNGSLVPLEQTGGLSKKQEEKLLALREKRLEAGLDVSDIDAQLGLDKKIGEDEVLGVSLIDDVLDLKTGALTGLMRGKLSATGILNPYQTAEARTKLKQLSAVLQLASAGKLKGQGTVTENERKILREAVSSLGINENGETELSDTKLRSELKKLQTVLAKKSNDPELVKRFSQSEDNGLDADDEALINKYKQQR
jgi:hypothetical protein